MLIAQILEGGASGEKHDCHHSACTYSTPRLGGSGGMLLQVILHPLRLLLVASETILHQSLMVPYPFAITFVRQKLQFYVTVHVCTLYGCT